MATLKARPCRFCVYQLTKTFFSPRFGMVADRFGVSWMVYVAP
jgi:uncharacterized glyoxalase superfamily protein PhnB